MTDPIYCPHGNRLGVCCEAREGDDVIDLRRNPAMAAVLYEREVARLRAERDALQRTAFQAQEMARDLAGQLDAAERERDALRSIVAALAAAEPVVGALPDAYYCALCDLDVREDDSREHEPECPWRRAREAVGNG